MSRSFHLLLGGLLALASLTATSAQAQTTITVTRPSWGPAAPATAQYYYVPEIDGYYDLRGQQYVVRREGRWQRLAQLSGANPTAWHPVVIDYLGEQPWSRHDEYRRRYPAALPPGQRKRLDNGKGLPPGQAKKYGNRYGDNDRDGGRDDRNRDKGKGKDRDDRYGDDHQPGMRRPETSPQPGIVLDSDERRLGDGRDERDDHDKRGKKYKGYKNKGKDKD